MSLLQDKYPQRSAAALIAAGAASEIVGYAILVGGPNVATRNPIGLANYISEQFPDITPRQRQTLIQAVRNQLTAAARQEELPPDQPLPLSQIPVIPGRTGTAENYVGRFLYRVIVGITPTEGATRYITIFIDSDGPLSREEIESRAEAIVDKEFKPNAFATSLRGKRKPGPLLIEIVTVSRAS